MSEKKYDLQSANMRLDDALNRLEKQLGEAKMQLADAAGLQLKVETLSKERSRLAVALEETTERADEVEGAAKQVSLRIIGAMEKVQMALNGESEG